jgi:hypothetical protein
LRLIRRLQRIPHLGAGRAHKPRSATGRPSNPVTIRATEEERAAWGSSARHLERTLSEWCRDALNAAAEQVLNSRAARPIPRQR